MVTITTHLCTPDTAADWRISPPSKGVFACISTKPDPCDEARRLL